MSAFDSACFCVCAAHRLLHAGHSETDFFQSQTGPDGRGHRHGGGRPSELLDLEASGHVSRVARKHTSRNERDKKRLSLTLHKLKCEPHICMAGGGGRGRHIRIMDWINQVLFLEPVIHSHSEDSVTAATWMLGMSSTLAAWWR